MHRETDAVLGPHEYFPSLVFRSRQEAEEELSRPCGRFKTPESMEGRFGAFLAERVRPLDPFGRGQTFAGHGMPLNWQHLLAHLHQRGVTAGPRIETRPVAHDRPKFPRFRLGLNRASRATDGKTENYAAFGASFSAEDAISKTIGEALERYFLSLYRRDSMRHASYAELARGRRRILDLSHLNAFLPFQRAMFPELGADMNSPLYWIEGESYPSGAKTLIPAQLVFWNYRHEEDVRDEKTLARITTSGCAGHFSRDEAILAGLLENIQRDGFLIFWLNRLSPPVLDLSRLADPRVNELLDYIERYRLEAVFLNTTSDISVPSVTCAIVDRAAPGGPFISVGAATGFDLKNVLIQSAVEALTVNNYIASRPAHGMSDAYKPFSDNMFDREKRLNAWKGPRMAEHFSFFLAGKKQDVRELEVLAEGKDSVPAQLAHVLGEFERCGEGYGAFVHEVHDPLLDELGFHVVRTIVPQLVPLYLFEHTAPLDTKRIREVPRKLGYRAAKKLNPWPHPFP